MVWLSETTITATTFLSRFHLSLESISMCKYKFKYIFVWNPNILSKSIELNYNVNHHIHDKVYDDHDHDLHHDHAVKFDIR